MKQTQVRRFDPPVRSCTLFIVAICASLAGSCGRKSEERQPAPQSSASSPAKAAAPVESKQGKCRACRDQHCRNYLGADLIAGCFERVDSTFGAQATDANFLRECAAVIDCAHAHRCAYDDARQAGACYCGSRLVDDCEPNGPAPDAPCVKEWEAATRATSNLEVLHRMSLMDYPAGWAFNVLGCEREYCRSVCAQSEG